MMTFDKFVAMHMIGRVDFIKLDFETFELFVLHGAAEMLSLSDPLFLSRSHFTGCAV